MPARRAKGTGGLTQIAIQRANGTTYKVWRASVEYRDQAGKKRTRTATARTLRAAEAKLLDLRNAVNQPAPLPPPASPTLAAYLEEWLSTTKRLIVKPGSLEKYATRVRVHIVPQLGDRELASLTAPDVQRLQAVLLDRGLSPATVSGTLTTLRDALQQAEDQGQIVRNPVRGVRRVPVRRVEPAAVTLAEAAAIERAVAGSWLETAVTLGLYLGLREGEVLGLRWTDVDWERGVLTVDGQWTRRAERATTKTRKVLTLPLIPRVAASLRTQRARQAEARLKAGRLWIESDYVFGRLRGAPPAAATLYQGYTAALRKAGVRHRTFHELRHGTATLLTALGVPPDVIAAILGHSDLRVTSRYTQVDQSTMRSALERLERAMEG